MYREIVFADARYENEFASRVLATLGLQRSCPSCELDRPVFFISLYRTELDNWLPDVQQRLNRLRAPNPDRVARVLTGALRERTRFCRLTVVLSSVLEHNLSEEFIRDFKTSLLVLLGKFSFAMKEVLELSDEAVQDFLFQHHATIAGLWPLAHPSPQVSEVLQDSQFEGFRIDFYRLFEQTICQLLAVYTD